MYLKCRQKLKAGDAVSSMLGHTVNPSRFAISNTMGQGAGHCHASICSAAVPDGAMNRVQCLRTRDLDLVSLTKPVYLQRLWSR
jgi:hypothetical protein